MSFRDRIQFWAMVVGGWFHGSTVKKMYDFPPHCQKRVLCGGIGRTNYPLKYLCYVECFLGLPMVIATGDRHRAVGLE